MNDAQYPTGPVAPPLYGPPPATFPGEPTGPAYPYGGPGYPAQPAWTPQPFDPAMLQPLRRRRRAPLVISVLVVLGLLLSGGAFAAASAWYGWGAVEPETAVPADVTAFARIDLDPGYGQQLKFARLLSKFNKGGAEDALLSVKRNLLSDSSSGLDYATDVAPWFADRVGVALWHNDSGEDVLLVALASKDDTRAGQALEKVRGHVGGNAFAYTVHDGFALLSFDGRHPQADVDAASASAQRRSLAENHGFTAAMDRLPGAHTALGYVDLVSMIAEVRRAVGSSGTGVEVPDLKSVTGALAFSAEAVGDGIAVHFTGPAGPGRTHADARALLDALPGDTIIGGALSGLPSEPSSGTQLNSAIQGMLRESGALGSSGRNSDDALAMLGSQLDTITDGLTALLTAQTLTFAVTDLGTSPSWLLNVQAADAAAADTISSAATKLVDNTDGAGDRVKIDRQGDTVRIRMGQPGSGRLADRPLYRQAMSGAAKHPQAAFYLDRTLIEPDGGPPADPVKAMAVTVSRQDSHLDGLLHIVIG